MSVIHIRHDLRTPLADITVALTDANGNLLPAKTTRVAVASPEYDAFVAVLQKRAQAAYAGVTAAAMSIEQQVALTQTIAAQSAALAAANKQIVALTAQLAPAPKAKST
jgi:hypothetical protein